MKSGTNCETGSAFFPEDGDDPAVLVGVWSGTYFCVKRHAYVACASSITTSESAKKTGRPSV